MTSEEYRDWWRASDVCLGELLPAHRFACFREHLSAAGADVLIVRRLLDENPDALDLARWWAGGVYAPFHADDGRRDLERTAAALDAIEAPLAAGRVRGMTIRPTSYLHAEHLNPDDRAVYDDLQRREREKSATVAELMPEWRAFLDRRTPTAGIEPRAEVAGLLERYAAAHAAELRADVEHHGDPRSRPGFDPERAAADRREREYRKFLRDEFRDKEADYRKRLAEAEAFLAGDPLAKPQKLDRIRRFFRERVDELESHAEDVLDERMAAFLADCRRLMERHPVAFPKVPTDDEAINRRLAEIGPYRLVRETGIETVTWTDAADLSCGWAGARLRFAVAGADDRDAAYLDLLDRWEEFRRHMPVMSAELRDALLDRFRTVHDDTAPGPFDDGTYGRDADGRVTDESILRHAGTATVTLTAGRPGVAIWCPVDWDEEHGFEAEAGDDGRLVTGW